MGSVVYLAETKKLFKNKTGTPGIKTKAVFSIMNHLEGIMRENGGTVEQIMKFEADFLESNGISVPESFWIERSDYFKSCDEYLENCTESADAILTGTEFYSAYSVWAKENGKKCLGKHECYSYLRNKGLMRNNAFVNGHSKRNVLIGLKIKEE